MFSHQRLLVYRKALSVAVDVFEVTARVHARGWAVSQQVQRAATSVLLNIAEGAGEYSTADKARFYRIARRSGAEAAAALELLTELKLVSQASHSRLQSALGEICAMLTTMIKRRDRSGNQSPARLTRLKDGPGPSPSPTS